MAVDPDLEWLFDGERLDPADRFADGEVWVDRRAVTRPISVPAATQRPWTPAQWNWRLYHSAATPFSSPLL